MVKVWLDDERPEPNGWIRAKTAKEAIALLEAGSVEEISLDHDLGEESNGNGHDVLCWLEEKAAYGIISIPTIRIHTANPVARVRMVAAVESIKRLTNSQKI